MFEIIVIADSVYKFPFKWAELTERAHEVGKLFNMRLVNVYQNGEWFCNKFTNIG